MINSSRRLSEVLPRVALLLALGFVAGPVYGEDGPQGMPPEIQQIIAKMRGGQRPTPEDLATLRNWQAGVTSRLNPPSSATGTQFVPPTVRQQQQGKGKDTSDQQGIPCRIEVSESYTGRQGQFTERGSVNGWADVMLFPSINGTGDYKANVLDPSARVSSFRFEPLAPGGKLAMTGGGQLTYGYTSPSDQNATRGHLTSARAGFMLWTTGKGDALFPNGGFDGPAEGSVTITQNNGLVFTSELKDNLPRAFGLHVPFVMEGIGQEEPGTPPTVPTMQISYKALVSAIAAGHGTVSGQETFSFTRNGRAISGQSSIQITLRPRVEKLIVEGDDKTTFESWLPLPASEKGGDPDIPRFFGKAKPVKVHVVLVDSSKPTTTSAGGKTRPNVETGGQLVISLKHLSQLPGIAMNYPQQGKTKPKPDLFFTQPQPAGIHFIDETHVETATATATEATVEIAARDPGAYGVVEASCPTLGLTGTNAKGDKQGLSVPLDDNNNHVADKWEKDNGVYGKNYPADWDSEDTPQGLRKGDGYTLFDEYRGFLVDTNGEERHQRLSPAHKKLFVMLSASRGNKPLLKQGADKYAEVSRVEVLYIHANSRMQVLGESSGLAFPRWVNFNKTPDTRTEQCAVWIDDKDTTTPQAPLGNTATLPDLPNWVPLNPDTVQKIDISPNVVRGFIQSSRLRFDPAKVSDDVRKAARDLHIDLEDVFKGRGDTQRLYDRMVVFCTLHELGHATGARHHSADIWNEIYEQYGEKAAEARSEALWSAGATTCPMRYWQDTDALMETLRMLAELWDPSAGPAEGGSWEFCEQETRNMALHP
ncbi:MAG TPA: hypothetical protein VKZ18_02180 [Polyangia bacterium]|nr:hypothetical protein [Polyangia bacterium]